MWDRPGGLEILFERLGAQGYIEGRAPGAVFPTASWPMKPAPTSRAAPLAPSALQLGLLRNPAQAEALMRDWGWHRLRALRQIAIRDALADDAVHALARDVVQVAHDGLERGPALAGLCEPLRPRAAPAPTACCACGAPAATAPPASACWRAGAPWTSLLTKGRGIGRTAGPAGAQRVS